MASLVGQIYSVLDQFHGRSFENFSVTVRHQNRDEKTTRCMISLLQNASMHAFLRKENARFLIGYADDSFFLEQDDVTSLENQVDSKFVERVRKSVHVYLHYLWQGWLFTHKSSQITIWEKTEDASLISSSEAEIDFFAYKVGGSLNVAFDPIGRGGEERHTLLMGPQRSLIQFRKGIRKEAEGITPIFHVPLLLIVARGRGNTRKFNAFVREKIDALNQQVLIESQKFLIDNRELGGGEGDFADVGRERIPRNLFSERFDEL